MPLAIDEGPMNEGSQPPISFPSPHYLHPPEGLLLPRTHLQRQINSWPRGPGLLAALHLTQASLKSCWVAIDHASSVLFWAVAAKVMSRGSMCYVYTLE